VTAAPNILAISNPMHHLMDRPWRIAGHDVPWLSSHIAVMILTAILVAVALPLLARRYAPRGREHSMGLVEMIVMFIREQMARPLMPDVADRITPLLASLFVFLLANNLMGLIPLYELSQALSLDGWGPVAADGAPMFVTPIGGTPTSGFWVAAAFAIMTFATLMLATYVRGVYRLATGTAAAHSHLRPGEKLGLNLWAQLTHAIQRRRWPVPAAAVVGLWTWLDGFVPVVPGVVGLLMWPILLVIEMIGYVAKCFALCIRLVANMSAGHILLAVMLLFAESARGWLIPIVGPAAGAAVVLLTIMELFVAVVQAYIFTYLSALFLALALGAFH
jgi:F-type H+-transporting ATPase subunit a